MWYVPQGLNIWEQIICEFPGHYARDAEKCNDKAPGADPQVNRFDGPAWRPPTADGQNAEPKQPKQPSVRMTRPLTAAKRPRRAGR